jgi:hypothetical protein
MTRVSNRSELNRETLVNAASPVTQHNTADHLRYGCSSKFLDLPEQVSKLNVVHPPLTIVDGELKL